MEKTQKYWIIGLGLGAIALAGLVYAYRKEIKKMFKFGCDDSFLFIGDSTSAGSFSYADLFKKECPDARITKIAKSGAKTSWMLDELKKELEQKKYDVITILGGSNDIFGNLSITEAKKNMNEMFELAKKNGARVISISPPSKLYSTTATDKHRKLITEWEEFLKTHPIPGKYIDLAKLVQEEKYFASDKQHITPEAHTVLADEFMNQINFG